MKKELFQIIMLSVLLIYFIYHGMTSDFPCVLHNHSHPNLSFCDHIPHHKV